MNKRILALAGAAALAVPLAACSSGPPSPPSVLQADGYSQILNQSTLAAFGNVLPQKDRRYVSGYAVGYKTDGQAEAVIIVTQAGAATITPAQLANGYHGVHISLSGDVVRMTGTVSQFSQMP
jgi:hypothetical protein